MNATGASGALDDERLVLVGRRWKDDRPTDWSVWGRDYDEAIETVSERCGTYKPGVGFEVIEVTVHRRAVVMAEIKVTETVASDESAVQR